MNKLTAAAIILLGLAVLAQADTIGLWGFNQSSGTTAYDSSGNNHDAAMVDSQFVLSGNTANGGDWGNEARMTTTTSYLNLGTAGDIGLTSGSFTIECWFQVSQIADYSRIFSLSKSSDGKELFAVWFRNTTTIQSVLYNDAGTAISGTSSYTSATALNNSDYYHVAAVYNSANNSLRVYLNGQVGTVVYPTAAVDLTAGEWLVGGKFSTSSTILNGLSGDIDEVRISSAALTAGELGYYTGPLVEVPEPVTMLLLGGGLFGAIVARKRKI